MSSIQTSLNHFSSQNNNTLSPTLQFTGNWFVDAGILGFVNLMEEVYGWDFNELKRKIKENADFVYYGYFPFAYLFYHSKIRESDKEIRSIRKEIANLKEKLNKKKKDILTLKNSEISTTPKVKKKILKIEENISKIEKQINEKNAEIKAKLKSLENEKINFREKVDIKVPQILKGYDDNFLNSKEIITKLIGDFELNPPESHRNFFLYNPKKDLFSSFGYLYFLLMEDFESLSNFVSNIMGLKNKELTYEVYPDSTVNPFLYSYSEFPNIGYTLPQSVKEIRNSIGVKMPVYLFLLSFFNSFQFVSGERIMFYTNSLELSYTINKRLKMYLQQSEKNVSILQLTWRSILDELIERKSGFSLENMYLLIFKSIDKQKLQNVEFVGIPRLQASIVLDDKIRDSLNIRLLIEDHWVWILEEFIKNRPLYPTILRYVTSRINNNKILSKNTRKLSLYALAVDAKIKENNSIELFSDEFFTKYRDIVSDIKETYKELSIQANNISKLFDSRDERQNLCYSLMAGLKRRNRIAFTNILLKKFLENTGKKEISYLTNFVFNRITTNDISWENYALALVVGVWSYGGENVGGAAREE